MSRSRRDDPDAGAQRSAAERERARLEREARRGGTAAPPPAIHRAPDVAAARDTRRQHPTHASLIPRMHERSRVAADRARRTAAHRRRACGGSSPTRRRRPPHPPARWTTRPSARSDPPRAPPGRPIVTPPGDTPAGPARAPAHPRVRGSAACSRSRCLRRRRRHAAALSAVRQRAGRPRAGRRSRRARAPARSATSSPQAGIVDSAFLFRVRATLSGKRDSLRSGGTRCTRT